MIALCVSAGALSITLWVESFTLAWMHSVEKIRWEEDWKLGEKHLYVTQARIQGSGAGMEPPLDAVFENGFWHYTPHVPPLEYLSLMHSTYTKEYEVCFSGVCHPITTLLPELKGRETIILRTCE